MTNLVPFSNDIWLANGPVINAAFGFHYPTRMAVIRLLDGGLFIWSAVALSASLEDEVRQLGPVRHLIAPNSLHDSFIEEWAAAFPDAQLHAAPGLAQKRTDIPFSQTLGDEAVESWRDTISQVVVAGNAITTEVVFFHKTSGTVLFTDLLQQLPSDWFKGWRRYVARFDLMTEEEPHVPRKFRLAFRDRALARRAIRQILNWPVENVVMAHGTPVQGGGSAYLRRAFRWLQIEKE